METIVWITMACLAILGVVILARAAKKARKTERYCVHCKKSMGYDEPFRKVRQGETFYVRKKNKTTGRVSEQAVHVGKSLLRARGSLFIPDCPPGRVCMGCWESFIPADKMWAEQKEFERQLRERKRRERERERRERETIRNPVWVLQNMPVASQHTLQRWGPELVEARVFDDIAEAKRAFTRFETPPMKDLRLELTSKLLGNCEVKYAPDKDELSFSRYGPDYQQACRVVRTSDDSWAISGSRIHWTDY